MTPLSYPFSRSTGTEIDPEYARLRAEEPLARVRMPHGGEAWLVTCYGDVRTVLSDSRFSRAATLGRDVPRLVPLIQQVPSILTLDPPEHTRLRRLVAGAFTARRIQELNPKVEGHTAELIDALISQGPPADLVSGLSRPLPLLVICEMLGVPYEDRRLFTLWSEAMRSTGAGAARKMREAGRLPWEYLADRIAIERARPSDTLLGALVRARDEDDRLSEQELVSFAVTLLLAGHETTTDEIGSSVYTLLKRPAHWKRLRTEPGILDSAVEELLRFVPIGTLSGFTRIATEDVLLSGGWIRKGEAVVVQADSANHDEAVFHRADELNFDRESNRHLAFGYGPHRCLGAQLALIELRTVLRMLVTRLPNLALSGEPMWKHGRSALGPETLPVTWGS